MAPSKNRKFVVQMYESEYRQIQGWVAKYQNLETGGDLFGLWAEDNTTVVQLVLGPGKHCRRSSVSFYQDVDYLERVGNILTTEEGLCHIGEWHSHHKLGLSRPSGGDENTVWTNMDRYGINRFFLFIATIGSSSNDVNVGCFLFEINPNTKRREPVLKGEIHPFGNEESPFRKSVKDHLAEGAESQNSSESLKRFKSNVIGADFVRDSTGKRGHDYHEQDHKKPKLQDTDNYECHTTMKAIDQEMEESNKVDYQEDKSEDMKDKDTEKSKLSQEVENQGNELGCNQYATQDNNDNMQHGDQQPNLTEDNNKPEILKNQPSIPVTTEEIINTKSSSAKGAPSYKVWHIDESEVQENNEVSHVEESNDGKATEKSSSKNIIQDPKVILVKPAKEENDPNQHQPSNALDQNEEDTVIEDSIRRKPQLPVSETYVQDELKDAQPNIRPSSAICSKTEENSPSDKDLDTEDEKHVTCKWPWSSLMEKRRRKKKENKESKKKKKEDGNKKKKDEKKKENKKEQEKNKKKSKDKNMNKKDKKKEKIKEKK